MNTTEALQILREELRTYEQRPYHDLTTLVGQVIHKDRLAPSGTNYQIDAQFMWDDARLHTIRVIVAIDDSSLRYSVLPMSEDFIMKPDGSLVGK